VGVVWLSVLSLVIVCGRISRLAGALLVPYLIWVAFASTINFGVVQLNPG
jgi:tryptophan-rich sensory protein